MIFLDILFEPQEFCKKEIKRISIDKKQTIICMTNLSSKIQRANLNKIYHNWKNLIGSKIEIKNKFLILKPFETIWLSNI